MIYYVIGGLLWVICGVLAWGFMWGSIANSRGNWCRRDLFDYLLPVFGPAALLAVFGVDGFENWSWRPMTRFERFRAFQQKYEILGRTYKNFDL